MAEVTMFLLRRPEGSPVIDLCPKNGAKLCNRKQPAGWHQCSTSTSRVKRKQHIKHAPLYKVYTWLQKQYIKTMAMGWCGPMAISSTCVFFGLKLGLSRSCFCTWDISTASAVPAIAPFTTVAVFPGGRWEDVRGDELGNWDLNYPLVIKHVKSHIDLIYDIFFLSKAPCIRDYYGLFHCHVWLPNPR